MEYSLYFEVAQRSGRAHPVRKGGHDEVGISSARAPRISVLIQPSSPTPNCAIRGSTRSRGLAIVVVVQQSRRRAGLSRATDQDSRRCECGWRRRLRRAHACTTSLPNLPRRSSAVLSRTTSPRFGGNGAPPSLASAACNDSSPSARASAGLATVGSTSGGGAFCARVRLLFWQMMIPSFSTCEHHCG
jgi:hypothetical protein